MNDTVFNSDEKDVVFHFHYEKNQPKLQWLAILIPVMGVFAIYTFLRIHNKRKRAKQQVLTEAAAEPNALSAMMTNVIVTTPAPIFPHYQTNNHITTNNDSIPSRVYDLGQRAAYPLLRFSNNSYNNNTAITFWQRFQGSSHQTSSTDNTQQNRQRRRQRRRRDQRRRNELNRTPSPPPVYSISSPPKYEEVIALEQENEAALPSTCTSNNVH